MNVRTGNINAEELVALDTAHHFHPFTDHAALAKEGGAKLVTHADKSWLWDADGRKILDGMAGLWCVNVGYGRKRLAEAAYAQMQDLPYYNTFFKTTTIPAVELAGKVGELLPAQFNKVFFVNSGSEANDTVVRLVRHYWALKGEPERNVIISRDNAYHGSTMASASLGGMQHMHSQGGLPIPGIAHVQQPYWYGEGGDLTPDEFGLKAAQAIEQKIQGLGAERVAAFIGEPIQGAGGVIVPPDTYWPEVQRICRKYGILLIADEVICGFGRTGNWWGFETLGIEPDIVPMAKGLSSGYAPIGAVGIAHHIVEVLDASGDEFAHGFTYSGHPVSCAVALENIRIFEEEDLVGKVREIAPHFAAELEKLEDHPLVGEVRAIGLLGAIEIVRDKEKRERFEEVGKAGGICRDQCMANDLIMRACRDTMVLSPPLVITRAEITDLAGRARKALDATYEALKPQMK